MPGGFAEAAKIIERRRKIGAEAQCGFKGGAGFIAASGDEERMAENIVGFRSRGLEGDGLAECRDRLSGRTGFERGDSEIEPDGGFARGEARGFAEGCGGFRETTERLECVALLVVRFGECGRDGAGLSERVERLRGSSECAQGESVANAVRRDGRLRGDGAI